MPDITMCQTTHFCDQKEFCYRWNATPSEYQSYANFEPVVMFGGTDCEYFMPPKATQIKQRIKE